MENTNIDVSENQTNWSPLNDKDIANMFGDYILYSTDKFQEQLQSNQFSYEVFDADYYASKFPGFANEVYEILADVSQKKILDLRKDDDTFKIQHGEFNPFKDEK